MPNRKVTFSLDERTASRIGALADELGIARSAVVREAVAFYRKHADQVSEEERDERVRAFRKFLRDASDKPS